MLTPSLPRLLMLVHVQKAEEEEAARRLLMTVDEKEAEESKARRDVFQGIKLETIR